MKKSIKTFLKSNVDSLVIGNYYCNNCSCKKEKKKYDIIVPKSKPLIVKKEKSRGMCHAGILKVRYR